MSVTLRQIVCWARLAMAMSLIATAGPGLANGPQAQVTRVVAGGGLAGYYAKLEASLLSRGFLRGTSQQADRRVTADDLSRAFHAIALSHEYGGASALMRWEVPVSVQMTFGPSVSPAQRRADRDTVRRYLSRLARVTGHPIRMRQGGAFEVLVVSADELRGLGAYLRSNYPELDQRSVRKITRMPKNYLCMVVALPGANKAAGYQRALAIVRSEHSERMRTSCYHEEIAQGLGLPNDARVRPSIFNDDEEFALLTGHDEMLLRILYDDRLASGMSAGDVQPHVAALSRSLAPN